MPLIGASPCWTILLEALRNFTKCGCQLYWSHLPPWAAGRQLKVRMVAAASWMPAARTSYCLSGRWRFFISLSGLKAAAKVTSLRQISGAMVRCSWLSSGLPQLWQWHCDQYTEYTMHFWHLSAQNLHQWIVWLPCYQLYLKSHVT